MELCLLQTLHSPSLLCEGWRNSIDVDSSFIDSLNSLELTRLERSLFLVNICEIDSINFVKSPDSIFFLEYSTSICRSRRVLSDINNANSYSSYSQIFLFEKLNYVFKVWSTNEWITFSDDWWAYLFFSVFLTVFGWCLLDFVLTLSATLILRKLIIWAGILFSLDYISEGGLELISWILCAPIFFSIISYIKYVYLVFAPLLVMIGFFSIFPSIAMSGYSSNGVDMSAIDIMVRVLLSSLFILTYFLIISLFRVKSRIHYMRTTFIAYTVTSFASKIFYGYEFFWRGSALDQELRTAPTSTFQLLVMAFCCFTAVCSVSAFIERELRLVAFKENLISEYRAHQYVVYWWHPFIRVLYKNVSLDEIRNSEDIKYGGWNDDHNLLSGTKRNFKSKELSDDFKTTTNNKDVQGTWRFLTVGKSLLSVGVAGFQWKSECEEIEDEEKNENTIRKKQTSVLENDLSAGIDYNRMLMNEKSDSSYFPFSSTISSLKRFFRRKTKLDENLLQESFIDLDNHDETGWRFLSSSDCNNVNKYTYICDSESALKVPPWTELHSEGSKINVKMNVHQIPISSNNLVEEDASWKPTMSADSMLSTIEPKQKKSLIRISQNSIRPLKNHSESNENPNSPLNIEDSTSEKSRTSLSLGNIFNMLNHSTTLDSTPLNIDDNSASCNPHAFTNENQSSANPMLSGYTAPVTLSGHVELVDRARSNNQAYSSSTNMNHVAQAIVFTSLLKSKRHSHQNLLPNTVNMISSRKLSTISKRTSNIVLPVSYSSSRTPPINLESHQNFNRTTSVSQRKSLVFNLSGNSEKHGNSDILMNSGTEDKISESAYADLSVHTRPQTSSRRNETAVQESKTNTEKDENSRSHMRNLIKRRRKMRRHRIGLHDGINEWTDCDVLSPCNLISSDIQVSMRASLIDADPQVSPVNNWKGLDFTKEHSMKLKRAHNSKKNRSDDSAINKSFSLVHFMDLSPSLPRNTISRTQSDIPSSDNEFRNETPYIRKTDGLILDDFTNFHKGVLPGLLPGQNIYSAYRLGHDSIVQEHDILNDFDRITEQKNEFLPATSSLTQLCFVCSFSSDCILLKHCGHQNGCADCVAALGCCPFCLLPVS